MSARPPAGKAPGPRRPAGASAVLWWIAWILGTIGAFFAACAFWTWFIAERLGSVRESASTQGLWVAAVFGTWMVFLVPLIVVMYAKVDKAYEDARMRREEAARGALARRRFRSARLEPERRRLSAELERKLRRFPDVLKGDQLVSAVLRDGRRIGHVFIRGRKYLLGVYGDEAPSFSAADIVDLAPVDLGRLPAWEPEKWLRLDGAGEEGMG